MNQLQNITNGTLLLILLVVIYFSVRQVSKSRKIYLSQLEQGVGKENVYWYAIKIVLLLYTLTFLTFVLGYKGYYFFRGEPVDVYDTEYGFNLVFANDGMARSIGVFLPFILYCFIFSYFRAALKVPASVMIFSGLIFLPVAFVYSLTMVMMVGQERATDQQEYYFRYEKPEESEPPALNPYEEVKAGVVRDKEEKDIYVQTDSPAVFPGGTKELTKYFRDNILLPDDLKEEAKWPYSYKSISFNIIIDTDGKVISHDQGLIMSSGLNREDDLAKQLDSLIINMPRWLPAKQDGKKIKFRHCLYMTVGPSIPLKIGSIGCLPD